MSERTGLSDLDVAVLDALVDVDAHRHRSHVKSARVLGELYRRTGIPPRYGYEVMCDMTAPWLVNVRVVDPHGNFGSPDFGPAGPRYTEIRLSEVGMLAIEAERGGPRVPIGFINGDIHVEGTRPPFDPKRVIDTFTLAATRSDVTDRQLVDTLGSPRFPTGCDVDGDIDLLFAGEACRLTLRACLAHEAAKGRDAIIVSALPPMASPSEIAEIIKERAAVRGWHPGHPDLAEETRLPIADIWDETHNGPGTRLVVLLERDTDPAVVEERLRDVWGIAVEVPAQLPAAVPTMVRDWIARCDGDPLIGLDRLRVLLR